MTKVAALTRKESMWHIHVHRSKYLMEIDNFPLEILLCLSKRHFSHEGAQWLSGRVLLEIEGLSLTGITALCP